MELSQKMKERKLTGPIVVDHREGNGITSYKDRVIVA